MTQQHSPVADMRQPHTHSGLEVNAGGYDLVNEETAARPSQQDELRTSWYLAYTKEHSRAIARSASSCLALRPIVSWRAPACGVALGDYVCQHGLLLLSSCGPVLSGVGDSCFRSSSQPINKSRGREPVRVSIPIGCWTAVVLSRAPCSFGTREIGPQLSTYAQPTAHSSPSLIETGVRSGM